MPGLNEWRRRFVVESLMLFLTIRGRINFLQLERYGKYDECTYRAGFEKAFDFLKFNSILVNQCCWDEVILGFDPSFLSKSGKCTPGLGYYYSGCDGAYKRGLEIGVISAIDIAQNTAYHVEAIQSPFMTKRKGKGRVVKRPWQIIMRKASSQEEQTWARSVQYWRLMLTLRKGSSLTGCVTRRTWP